MLLGHVILKKTNVFTVTQYYCFGLLYFSKATFQTMFLHTLYRFIIQIRFFCFKVFKHKKRFLKQATVRVSTKSGILYAVSDGK